MHVPGPEEMLAHAGFVRRLAFALARDESEAEDVVQDAWVAALARPAPVRASVRAWLAGVTRNVFRSRRRAESRRNARERTAARSDAAPSARDLAERADLLERLARAVKELEDPCRETLLLRYFDGLTPTEIAARTGAPLATVKTRQRRGLERLRERLQRERHDWRALLLPAVIGGRPRVAGPAVSTPVVSGALLVSLKTKIVLVAVLVLALGLAVLSLDRRPGGGAAKPPVPRADTPPLPVAGDTSPAGGGNREAGTADEDRRVIVAGSVAASDTGEPLSDASLTVELAEGTVRARTAADGGFLLDLPETPYRPLSQPGIWMPPHRIRVDAPGFAAAEVEVRIPPGEPPPRVSVRLAPVAARMTVAVVDTAGRPVADAELRITVPEPNSIHGQRHDSARTDEAGRFGPVEVGAGPVVVRARGGGLPEGRTKIFVPPGPVRDVDVTVVLPDGFPARGLVVDPTGRPVPDCRIRGWVWGDLSTVTDGEGRFTLPLANHGDLKVFVEREGWLPRERMYELRPDGETRIELHRAVTLEGRLLAPDGSAAPAGLRLFAGTDSVDHPIERGTEAGGRFRLSPLFPGRIRVRVQNGEVEQGCFEVDAAEGESRSGLVWRLSPSSRLRGRVADAATGAPIAGVRVGAGRENYPSVDLLTDEQGRFDVPWDAPDPKLSPTWSRRITFVKDGYRNEELLVRSSDHEDGRRYEIRMAPSGTMPDPATPAGAGETGTFVVLDESDRPLPEAYLVGNPPVKADAVGRIEAPAFRGAAQVITAPGREAVRVGVAAGETQTVRLRRSAPILGRVVDAGGRPRPGVRVDFEGGSALTDGAGRFRIEDVPAGEARRVGISAEGGGPRATAWAVAGGEEVRLVLPEARRIRIRFVAGETPGPGFPEASVYSTVPPDPAGGYLEGSWTRHEREDDDFVIAAPAEPVLVWFRLAPGPFRVFTVPVSAKGEDAVLAYDPSPVPPISGEVLGPEGTPVEGAEVRDAATGRLLGRTDAEGRVLPAALGRPAPVGATLDLYVAHPDFAPVIVPAVDLAAGNPVRARLGRGGKVRGRVTRDGRPLHRAMVRFRHLRGIAPSAFVRTGEDGTFETHDHAASGRAILEVVPLGGLPRLEEVRVTAGGTTRVEIEIP